LATLLLTELQDTPRSRSISTASKIPFHPSMLQPTEKWYTLTV